MEYLSIWPADRIVQAILLTHKVIWANQNTESFVYRWLRTHAMLDQTCFPAFVGASDINMCAA